MGVPEQKVLLHALSFSCQLNKRLLPTQFLPLLKEILALAYQLLELLRYRSLSGGGEGKQEIGRTGQRYEENSEKKKGISTELQESGWQNEYHYRFYLPFMVFEK